MASRSGRETADKFAHKFIVIAALAAIISLAGVMILSRATAVSIVPYVAILSGGTAAVFASLWQVKTLGPKTVFWVACILHLIAIFGVAVFEDDYFRFIWDGWRTVATGSPYGIAPADFFGEPMPSGGHALTLDGINYPELSTIYGPTLQFILALAYLCAGTDPIGLRIFFAAFNLILILLLLRWASPERAALYAWCPAAIAEIVIHIHPDGIMAMLLMAGLVTARRYPWATGLFFGLAAGAKIVALALWPLLLRVGWRAVASAVATLLLLYAFFLLQGQGAGFGTTGVFASEWYFNPLGFVLADILLPPYWARMAAALVGICIILFLHARGGSVEAVPVAAIFGIVLLVSPAVNNWYLLWLLPFAVTGKLIWPYAAAVILPFSYFTGLNLGDDRLHDFDVHPAAWSIQITVLIAALIWDYRRLGLGRNLTNNTPVKATVIPYPKIAIIIPALNEQNSIGDVIRNIAGQKWRSEPVIIVADNGSSDDTAKNALLAGAWVITEPQRGYGAACLAGLTAISDDTNIVLFMDGDGADVATEAPALVAPLIAGTADLVIGSRALGNRQVGAMTAAQLFGNWLATRLVWLIWGVRMTDLGPFRAIRRDALTKLQMADRDFGWTVEMQVKAVQQALRITELPADYRRRVGVSKISGTIRGVILAGTKILFVIGRQAYAPTNREALGVKSPSSRGGG